jgi:hypothetical protein
MPVEEKGEGRLNARRGPNEIVLSSKATHSARAPLYAFVRRVMQARKEQT